MVRLVVVVVVVVCVDLENSFRDNLINLMPVLVGRGQLVVKEVNGTKLTGKDLEQYFQVSRILNCSADLFDVIYTVSQKNCAKLFLSQVRQMSTKFDNFWHTDSTEDRFT